MNLDRKPFIQEHIDFLHDKKIIDKNNKLLKIRKRFVNFEDQELIDELKKYFTDEEINFYKENIFKIYLRDINLDSLKCINPSCNDLKYLKEMKLYEFCENCYKTLPKEEKDNLINSICKTDRAIKNTLKKYGVRSTAQLESTKEKQRKTNLEKYGGVSPSQNKKIRQKQIRTLKKTLSLKTINDKYLKIFKLRKTLGIKNINDLTPEFIKKNFLDKNNYIKLKKMKKYFNYKSNFPIYQFFKRYNINYEKSGGYSQAEKEIVNFIKSIYDGNIIENDRETIKPKELDILIPDKSLAIEYNGLFWHSDDKYRHLKKTEACESKNINLLHIFENEWLNPRTQEIWKSVISYKLGITKEKYFARKLEIKKVHTKEANEFLNENHLQGACPAKVKLGLYYENELISLMTFAKPRFNKEYEYELIRFASKKFTACVGCAQRLFKHFLKEYQPNSVISYANRRWASSLSNLYKSIGFKFLRISNPNFYYFKLDDPELKLYHRVKYQKHKLKDFPNYSPSKTAESIMMEAGYRRIYDSGNLVYEYQS